MACWDTTVFLDLLGRAGKRKQQDVEAKLRQLEHDQPHSTTRFNIAETLVGLQAIAYPEAERARLQIALSKLEILEFDARAMRIYPVIFAHLRRTGQLPGVMDMLIASVALAHGHRLITRNARHYQNIPRLRVDGY